MSTPVTWGLLSTAAIGGTVVRATQGSERAAVAVAGEDAVHRLQLDHVSRAIAAGEPLPYGRDDAVEQAATLAALAEPARRGTPVAVTSGAVR